MSLNTTTTLELSTAHLSVPALAWLEISSDADTSIASAREFGYFLSSIHAAEFEKEPLRFQNFPLDLMNVLRFAHANGARYVLFDTDADLQPGLPLYDGPQIDPSFPFIGDEAVRAGLYGAMIVDPFKVSLADLKLERSWTETLEAGDYEAPDGAWVALDDVVVRIRKDDAGDLSVSAYPREDAMAEPLASFIVEDRNPEGQPSP
ncbi:hypothetical protein [Pseudosulfitobacter pseudonitzschiae]|uniref:DUF5983 family protein n=1 Tax=Pseudosulfitobacter pseudonitzschiae TaxID=1402135 RepID=UPI003B827DEB